MISTSDVLGLFPLPLPFSYLFPASPQLPWAGSEQLINNQLLLLVTSQAVCRWPGAAVAAVTWPPILLSWQRLHAVKVLGYV